MLAEKELKVSKIVAGRKERERIEVKEEKDVPLIDQVLLPFHLVAL